MKIEPESLILDDGLCFKYKSFFISGNDESYIFAIVDLLVASFCGNGFLKKKLVNEESVVVDLFQVENKYVYVCEKYIGNNSVEEIEKNKQFLWIKKFAKEFGEEVLNINKPLNLNKDKILSYDKKTYEKYFNTYIKFPGSSTENFWKNFVKYFEKE